MNHDFQLVDVFGDGPFTGNPLAVLDGAGLDREKMQQIARWMNLSETVFLLPSTTDEADYRVRIFTLERELPFAGHPTLGTCHAWAERTSFDKSSRNAARGWSRSSGGMAAGHSKRLRWCVRGRSTKRSSMKSRAS